MFRFWNPRRIVNAQVINKQSCIRWSSTDAARPQRTIRQMSKAKSGISPVGWLLLVIPVSAFGLGSWQIKRKKWKEDLLFNLQDRTSQEPVDLPLDLSELSNMEYYPVRVVGTFDYSKQFLVGPRSLIVDGEAGNSGSIISTPGQTGWHVITPFKLSDRDLTILVNRGWIPNDKRSKSKLENDQQSNKEVEVVGIVRHGEQRQPLTPENQINAGLWYYRDLEKMSQLTGASPIFIDAKASTSVAGGPVGGQTRVSLRNEHFAYVLTWYSLSLATAFMWYRQFIHKIPVL